MVGQSSQITLNFHKNLEKSEAFLQKYLENIFKNVQPKSIDFGQKTADFINMMM